MFFVTNLVYVTNGFLRSKLTYYLVTLSVTHPQCPLSIHFANETNNGSIDACDQSVPFHIGRV